MTAGADQAAAIARRAGIEYVAQDQEVTLDTYIQAPASWGLDRIDQRPAAGCQVPLPEHRVVAARAIVIDTGMPPHTTRSSAGRAVCGFDPIGDGGCAP